MELIMAAPFNTMPHCSMSSGCIIFLLMHSNQLSQLNITLSNHAHFGSSNFRHKRQTSCILVPEARIQDIDFF